MHVPRRILRALCATIAAGALLAAASTAHAGVPGPPSLNPQPEPPGVAPTLTFKRGQTTDMGLRA